MVDLNKLDALISLVSPPRTFAFYSYEGPIRKPAVGHRASLCSDAGNAQDHCCIGDFWGETEAEAVAKAKSVAALLSAVVPLIAELRDLRALVAPPPHATPVTCLYGAEVSGND